MKYVIICVAVVVLIAGGFYLYILANTPKVDLSEIATPTPTSMPIVSSSPTPAPTKKATAWDVFQEFLAGIKAHDLDRVNEVAYEQIDPNVYCKDMGLEKDACLGMIWSLSDALGKAKEEFNKADFPNVSEDENQIIMATNISPDEITIPNVDPGYSKAHIYFVKNQEGNVLILELGTQTWRFTGDTLTNAIKDSDGDNLPDEDEKCEGANKYDKSCVKTNPNLKDTDGDGWWDSIEDAAKTDPNNSADYPFKI